MATGIVGTWSPVNRVMTLGIMRGLAAIYDWEQKFSLSEVTPPTLRIMKMGDDAFIDHGDIVRFIHEATGKKLSNYPIQKLIDEIERLADMAVIEA